MDRPPSTTTPTPRARVNAGTADALLEHFDRSPVGILLFGEDRSIVAANEAVLALTGLPAGLLAGSSLRRLLAGEAPEGVEERIFDEVDQAGRWLGQIDVRTSIAEASPAMMSLTVVGPTRDASGATVRYVGTVVELGQQRFIEVESSRRAAELAALSALAVATGSSVDPATMLRAAAREIVEGLEVDACWIHRYESTGGGRLVLAGEASYLHPTLRLSPRMIPDAINPGVLRAIETHEQVVTSELLDRSIATVVHAPLLAANEAVGVISILSVEGEKLVTRNSELLRAVSYQLGTAIQNIRLLEAITEHQAELEEKNEELERLVEELRVTDRLKSEFLANTSHELRTPLNSIIGFLSLVLDGLCKNEEEKTELLGHALQSAKHLIALINDVLD
ncbi:MAG TPA: histidine kinase dimerization/phospho-acceptor domain-containing protein, partial [Acidobacteriota bacterium]|nr:histidine kinase dimerization/phospho-acceptor domain-containing protein [Acidobacteriota bacterium]